MHRLPEKIIEAEQANIKMTRFFGVPVTELDRDSLLACAAIAAVGLHQAHERFREYAEFNRMLEVMRGH